MTNKEKASQSYMKENGMGRAEAERFVDCVEEALWSWEHPWEWDEAEQEWNDRNPRLRDDERI